MKIFESICVYTDAKLRGPQNRCGRLVLTHKIPVILIAGIYSTSGSQDACRPVYIYKKAICILPSVITAGGDRSDELVSS